MRTQAETADPRRFRRIVVLGGGAWGTALALVAARAGAETVLWARDAETVAAINAGAANGRHLPGVRFDAPVRASLDADVTGAADLVIAAVPAQAMRGVLRQIAGGIGTGVPIVSAAKGLERQSLAMMSSVISAEVPQAPPAVLSGPSFAADVARGLPTALTIAAAEADLAEAIAQSLASSSFRPYAATDLIGVELGGALKNVIAIAAGIVAGAELGASAQAALVARGFAEITRLATRLGAQPATLMGLSGLGDLVLSTGSTQSRNFALGHGIGRGEAIDRLTGAGAKLAEGAFTAAVAIDLAKSVGIDLPIAEAVADVLSGCLTVREAVDRLMTRPLRAEV